jgi:hypothetical protein
MAVLKVFLFHTKVPGPYPHRWGRRDLTAEAEGTAAALAALLSTAR